MPLHQKKKIRMKTYVPLPGNINRKVGTELFLKLQRLPATAEGVLIDLIFDLRKEEVRKEKIECEKDT